MFVLQTQVTANLKARLRKAEADLQLSHSKQQHMQLQLDSANAQNSSFAEELESAIHSNAQLEAECNAEREQCTQAKAECAHLERELHSAVQSQEALQQVVQELQATLETVKHQAHDLPSPSHTAHTVEAGTHGSTHKQTHQTLSTSANDSAAEADPSVVAALQQQVLELRAISAHLEHCQQQAQLQELEQPHGSRQQSGRAAACLQQSCIDRTCSAHHQHLHMPLRHSCKAAQAHTLPSQSQSVCQSPASCSYVHDTIRAHHGMQHCSDDKCWCGRPKRGNMPVLSTPMRHNQSYAVAADPKSAIAPDMLHSFRPSRPRDRYLSDVACRSRQQKVCSHVFPWYCLTAKCCCVVHAKCAYPPCMRTCSQCCTTCSVLSSLQSTISSRAKFYCTVQVSAYSTHRPYSSTVHTSKQLEARSLQLVPQQSFAGVEMT